jgi:hypothetical protein
VTADTPGAEFTCEATSAGGSASETVTVRRDAADATDNAGNAGSAAVSFEVVVTFASLCELTERFVSKAGVANAMCAKLDAAANARTPGAKKGALQAYKNHVRAQTGKSVSSEHAAILIRLADAL